MRLSRHKEFSSARGTRGVSLGRGRGADGFILVLAALVILLVDWWSNRTKRGLNEGRG